MKFWGISVVACCLLADIFVGQHLIHNSRPGYRIVTTNNVTIIMWQNQRVYQGQPSTISISPDAQSVAWVEDHLAGHLKVDGAGTPIYAGKLYMAHAGGQAVEIQKLKSARGIEFPEEDPDIGVVYHPDKFQWDHTSKYLYYLTQPWPTRAMLWQITPGSTVPHGIVLLWDYRLLKKWHGADWLEAYETNYAPPPAYRDWTTTYIYTPDEMANDKDMQPIRKGSVGKDWPQ